MRSPESPQALTAFALLSAVTLCGLLVGLVAWSVELGSYPDVLILIGLLAFCAWTAWALIAGFTQRGASLGGALGLTGFLVGSLLTLFPDHRVWKEFPQVTEWQAWCWLVATVLVIGSLERTRRERAPVSSTRPRADLS